MKADVDDTGFMDGMREILGMDTEAVENVLDTLDNDSLLVLTDAISKRDKQAALAVIQSFDNNVHVNPLFKGKDIEQPEEKKKPRKPPIGYTFSIGDDVAIRTMNDDGEEEFVSATVFQPNGPGDTIGVKIEGKPKMVDKDNDVFTLNEMIMGMVGVPSIQRMQQLAGMPEQVEAEVVAKPEESPMVTMDAVQQALYALDTLDHVLPNVRLADLKTIRQRITTMQTQMNESILSTMPAGRPKKK